MPRIVNNLEELKDLQSTMSGYYAKLHSSLKTDERYYDLDFETDLRLPHQFTDDAVVLPTAREVVDAAADQITPDFRRIEVPRRSASPAATTQARKLQRFYEALLHWIESQAPISPFREAAKQLPNYGILVGLLLPNIERMGKEPIRESDETDEEFKERKVEWNDLRKIDMPFSLTIVNPQEIMFDPFHDPPMWVIRTTKRFVYDIAAVHPEWTNRTRRGPSSKVDVIEYWDAETRYITINGESAFGDDIEFTDNKLKTIPYIIIGSGLGVDDSDHEPKTRYVGLLRYLRQILNSESRNYSMQDIVIKVGAWPIRVAEGERANEMPDIELEFGQIQPLPPGVTLRDLTPVLPERVIFEALTLANSIISSATAPRVIRGMGNAESGFDRQLALNQAKLKYGSMAFGIEQFLRQICVKAGLYIERGVIPFPVAVVAGAKQDDFFEITGRTFNGHHAVEVKINVLQPDDEIRKQQNAASLVNSGLMSPQTAITKFFPDVDPGTEMARILAARILFSPEVMATLSQAGVQKLVEKLGLEDLLAQVIAQSVGSGNSIQDGREPKKGIEGAPQAGDKSDQADQRQIDLRELGF